MDEERLIPIGKITGVHGLRGIVKVWSFAESMDPFCIGRKLYTDSDGKPEHVLSIRTAGVHKKGVLISFDEVQGLDAAERLIGTELLIERSALPEPEDGTYFWFDIIGLKVYSVSDDYLGVVESIIPTGSNDVYVVKDGEKETLVPALKSVLVSISTGDGIMKVDLPEGL